MIKLSKTFEIVTEGSAENGEAAESGFDWEAVDHTFKDLCDILNDGEFINPSESSGCPRWLSSDSVQDMHTGEYETKSLHPGSDRQSQKYWKKACIACGIFK